MPARNSINDLSRSIQRENIVLNNQTLERGPRKHISVYVHGDMKIFPIEDVLYFQADQNYVTLRHDDGEVIIEESLRSLEADFPEHVMRIHRNALVVKSRISGFVKADSGGFKITFKDIDDKLAISRRHIDSVRRFAREGR